jgi:hypothetical protein
MACGSPHCDVEGPGESCGRRTESRRLRRHQASQMRDCLCRRIHSGSSFCCVGTRDTALHMPSTIGHPCHTPSRWVHPPQAADGMTTGTRHDARATDRPSAARSAAGAPADAVRAEHQQQRQQRRKRHAPRRRTSPMSQRPQPMPHQPRASACVASSNPSASVGAPHSCCGVYNVCDVCCDLSGSVGAAVTHSTRARYVGEIGPPCGWVGACWAKA